MKNILVEKEKIVVQCPHCFYVWVDEKNKEVFDCPVCGEEILEINIKINEEIKNGNSMF